MKILSLDISSVSTGWCVISDGTISAHGVLKLKGDSHGQKLFLFEEAVRKLVIQHQVECFSFEDIWRGPSIKTFKVLAFYHGIAHKICFELLRGPPIVLMPSAIRSVLVDKETLVLSGKRDEDKESVFDYLNAKYDLKFDFKKDNDITDAIALCLATNHMLIEHGTIDLVIQASLPKKKKKRKDNESVPSTRRSKRGKQRRDKKSV